MLRINCWGWGGGPQPPCGRHFLLPGVGLELWCGVVWGGHCGEEGGPGSMQLQ